MPENPKARVFISCGQRKETEEVEIANQIRDTLTDMGFEQPYVAVVEQYLEGLTEVIFQKLEKSEYFIFIDFKREKLANNEYRGSLFCQQELAIASFLEKEVCGFREEGVEQNGILPFVHANLEKFDDRKKLPELVCQKVKKLIEEEKWNQNWRNELTLEREDSEYGDALHRGAGKPARWYHIDVKNCHWREIARDCVAYLESIENCSTRKKYALSLVEFKWRGVNIPRAAIPPQKSRHLDAFYVFHDSPNTVFLGINPFIVDYSQYRDDYILKGPGAFKLTYVVFSDNFSPARKTFYLEIGATLEDIIFTSGEGTSKELKKEKTTVAETIPKETTSMNADLSKYPISGQ